MFKFIIFTLMGCVCSAETYHVSITGNDSNPGTEGSPFLTITRFATNCAAGDTCIIHAGTYRETITPTISGTASTPITYQAATGESVTVSGADVISSWSLDQGAIYKSGPQSWSLGRGHEQMFCDSVMLSWASWPTDTNFIKDPTNFYAPTGGITVLKFLDNYGTLEDTNNLTQADGYWNGATVHFAWSPRYYAATGLVTNFVSGVLQMQIDCMPVYAGYSITNSGIYYLSGVSNCLTSAGQFYLDANTNAYVWLWDGSNPTGHTVEMKRRNNGFNLIGKSYTIISNINFFACTIESSATSTNIVIDGCNFKYPSWICIAEQLGDGNISNGTGYANTTNTGVILKGYDHVFKNGSVSFSSGNGILLYGTNCSVLNSYIQQVDSACTGCAGVYFTRNSTGYSTISNSVISCTFSNCARDSIILYSSQYATILSNIIMGTGYKREMSDFGAIYSINTDGYGTEIAYNTIGDTWRACIYLDQMCTNYLIHHNLIFTNDGYSSQAWGILMNGPCATNRIYNNTSGRMDLSYYNSGGYSVGHDIRNNICTTYVSHFDDGVTFENNTKLNDLSTPVRATYFVNEGTDYRLKGGSPAINAGVNVGLAQDIIGKLILGVPDLGCYEFGTYGTTPILKVGTLRGP